MDNTKKLIGALVSSAQSVGDWVLGFGAGIVVLMVIWGGIQYITGNAEGGKKTLLAAVIGLAIMVLSYWIIWLIFNSNLILQ